MTRPASEQPSDRAKERGNRPTAPTKAETALLPPFEGLALEQIHLPRSEKECREAEAAILAAGRAGFDTEARPTFRAGQKSDGPHVVQFALPEAAYIFQLQHSSAETTCARLLASRKVLKVGFGLKNDKGQIRDRLGITLTHVLDLDQTFRQLGYRGKIGVRGAMGALLKLGFKKSKSVTTSNWAQPKLRANQLLYAANDAYAALVILQALEDKGLLKP